MRTKIFTITASIAISLAFAVTGCTSSRSDAQIAQDVQNKINSDANIQNKQVTITSDKGMVTLTGSANSDVERADAGNDAGQVQGVKTVVNNLQVASAAMPAQNMNDMNQQSAANPEPPVTQQRSRTGTTSTRVHRRAQPVRDYNNTQTQSDASSTGIGSGNAVNTPPPAPAPPATVTIPDGSTVSIRLIDPLNSDTNRSGDTFRASLEQPLVGSNDSVAVPAGSEIQGTVVDAKPSTHFSGHSDLVLQLTSITSGGRTYEISTNQWQKQGSGRGKRSAETIGGGAGLGALIGGLLGGGKGAAIGAGAGAAAGTGVQGATKGQKVELPSETRLDFRLQNSLTVTPTGTSARNRAQ